MKQITIKNSLVLDEHIKRTELAELRLERLEDKDQMLTGFFKISMALLGLAATIIGIIAAIRSL